MHICAAWQLGSSQQNEKIIARRTNHTQGKPQQRCVRLEDSIFKVHHGVEHGTR